MTFKLKKIKTTSKVDSSWFGKCIFIFLLLVYFHLSFVKVKVHFLIFQNIGGWIWKWNVEMNSALRTTFWKMYGPCFKFAKLEVYYKYLVLTVICICIFFLENIKSWKIHGRKDFWNIFVWVSQGDKGSAAIFLEFFLRKILES